MNQNIPENQTKNVLLSNITNIFNSVSLYSPIIVCSSIVMFSLFTATIVKAFVFFVWIFIITFIRIIIFKGLNSSNQLKPPEVPAICLTGLTDIFIPQDVTYSLYILSFTLMYLISPMILISVQNKSNFINFRILAFFIAYIVLDLFIKRSLFCIPSFFTKIVIGDILSGLFLGATISGLLMYGTKLKSYLYINETNSNNEVCSVPSKQQFKCKMYKNGELVGNI